MSELCGTAYRDHARRDAISAIFTSRLDGFSSL
jgi:hypothetical protein